MKLFKRFALAVMALVVTFVPASAPAQDATELMKAAHLKMYYPGDDGSASVKMVITDKRGKTRVRPPFGTQVSWSGLDTTTSMLFRGSRRSNQDVLRTVRQLANHGGLSRAR